MDLHDGTPFWPKRDGLPSVYGRLRTDESCDVVVVGGGITGALIALELTKRGANVVVLDRREVGGGSTSASTAMLQYEIDELLMDLTKAIGPDRATTAYRECARGIDLVERATQDIGQICAFRRSPSVFMAIQNRDLKTVTTEMDARAEAGFAVRWLDGEELRSRWGLIALGAVESQVGGSVDPFLLCHHALRTVADRGGRIYGRTEAAEFDFSSRRVSVTTDTGARVRAKHAVFATGYEVEKLLPELPFALHSSFAVVTQPVAQLSRRYPNGMLFWDYDDPYLYGRTTDDDRILIGGKDERYRDPLRRHRALPTKARSLMGDLARRLPEIGDIEFGYSWCGTFAETPDGLAYLGGHPKFPRCQFALGFGGNGITYSALGAQYIADALLDGNPPPEQDIFRVDRPIVRPS